jgi:hypothetical protein
MIITTDPVFQSAIDTLALPGVAVGHRLISPGDEHALLKEEVPALAASVVKVRRASGAARIVARQLLTQLGYANCALPKGPAGAPVWPAGIVGSLAHDSRVAVAAVGMRADVGALGIDVEPAGSTFELLDLVVTPPRGGSTWAMTFIVDDCCSWPGGRVLQEGDPSAGSNVPRTSRCRNQSVRA